MKKSTVSALSVPEAASKMVTDGKILLLQHQPFYASLALNMEFVECGEIPTADVDGKTIRYNPAFILKQDVRQVAGLLAHEVMHVALMHHTRRFTREPQRWNYACDYAINPLLMEAGMRLPKGGLFSKKFLNMSAEEIYELLPPCKNGDAPGFGEVRDEPGGADNRGIAEAESRGSVAQAVLHAKMRGTMSGDLDRLVKEILEPKVDWREALAMFVTEISRADYTWSKPSARFAHLGLYMPKLESTETGHIIIIVDTSSSIDEKMISSFSAEITSIAETFSIRLQVIYVDSKFRSIQDLEPGEDIVLKPKGGGGTDFVPGFDYIEEHDLQPRAVVYLTDGACDSFPEEPYYPVLWTQFGHYTFNPPFGMKIQISNY